MHRLVLLHKRTTVTKVSTINRIRSPNGANFMSAQDAMRKFVKSGDHIFVQGISCNPQALQRALCERADGDEDLNNIRLYNLHMEGKAAYTDPKYSKVFRGTNLFLGASCRAAVDDKRADWMSVFLHEVPLLFETNVIPLNVSFISTSLPDKHGYMSFGPDVTTTAAAIHHSDVVIAQVNKNVPRCHGHSFIHVKECSALVEAHEPLPGTHAGEKVADIEVMNEIGKHIAELVEDGSTLQMGIGGIPDATLKYLNNHKDLGIHTEMFSDGVLPLIESGVVNNSKKGINPFKTVASFCTGTKKLFDFIDDNPSLLFLPSQFVNNPTYISLNPKVVAINSCIEIDLTGQVCSDSIGSRLFSGIGGQVDFERGAALSHGGKPIIALPSTTSKGKSRIVPYLQQGAGVVTSRGHVHWVITEYGKAYLFGKSVRERAWALIQIAHPNHRQELEKHFYENLEAKDPVWSIKSASARSEEDPENQPAFFERSGKDVTIY